MSDGLYIPHTLSQAQGNLTHYLSLLMNETGVNGDVSEINAIITPLVEYVLKLEQRVVKLERTTTPANETALSTPPAVVAANGLRVADWVRHTHPFFADDGAMKIVKVGTETVEAVDTKGHLRRLLKNEIEKISSPSAVTVAQALASLVPFDDDPTYTWNGHIVTRIELWVVNDRLYRLYFEVADDVTVSGDDVLIAVNGGSAPVQPPYQLLTALDGYERPCETCNGTGQQRTGLQRYGDYVRLCADCSGTGIHTEHEYDDEGHLLLPPPDGVGGGDGPLTDVAAYARMTQDELVVARRELIKALAIDDLAESGVEDIRYRVLSAAWLVRQCEASLAEAQAELAALLPTPDANAVATKGYATFEEALAAETQKTIDEYAAKGYDAAPLSSVMLSAPVAAPEPTAKPGGAKVWIADITTGMMLWIDGYDEVIKVVRINRSRNDRKWITSLSVILLKSGEKERLDLESGYPYRFYVPTAEQLATVDANHVNAADGRAVNAKAAE